MYTLPNTIGRPGPTLLGVGNTEKTTPKNIPIYIARMDTRYYLCKLIARIIRNDQDYITRRKY